MQMMMTTTTMMMTMIEVNILLNIMAKLVTTLTPNLWTKTNGVTISMSPLRLNVSFFNSSKFSRKRNFIYKSDFFSFGHNYFVTMETSPGTIISPPPPQKMKTMLMQNCVGKNKLSCESHK